ncbi:MAG: leucyl aminopeptidase [Actinomycetota bacterium]|nr:leucyl aminopeptidase [Actinomycetota bacterium]MDQ2958696.1 leucyl aminopeptidase [Actinomycetota bacterium]
MTSVYLIDAAQPMTADVVILGSVWTGNGVTLAAGSAAVDAALGGLLGTALTAMEATGRSEEVCRIPSLGHGSVPLVVVTGLGQAGDPLNLEAVRRAVGAAMRTINKAKRVAIAIGDGTDPALVGAICDGALLGSYRFDRFRSAARPAALKRIDIAVHDPSDAAAKAAIRRSRIVSAAVNNTRDLVNTPANHLNPVTFADYAEQQGVAAGLSVEVLDERALSRGKFGGILAVGAGSATPPRLVRLSYQPAKAHTTVALVGKGITFDTGGLDLKLTMMAQMKSDMGGAAAVVEAVIAAAKLKLPVAVTATVPMAENAVSGTAYRPSDVLVMRNGSTVEVDNTDAEGRLILADAISRACEDSPDYLIETATLTGGQVIALGEHTAGAMGSEAFRDRVVAIGNAAGESLWPMPLTDDLRPRLDSPVADITNLPKERWGSMLAGGSFLRDFVTDGVQWVHLDIAGPAFTGTPAGYNHKGGTGFIVRTILATLTELAEG